MVRIALPVADGRLSMHFGHCEAFALIDADPDSHAITGSELVPSPPHQPGFLPVWLSQRGAEVIIAGGMGVRAQSLFQQHGIRVVVGAPSEAPELLVADYLNGSLEPGGNPCDHSEHGGHGCHGGYEAP